MLIEKINILEFGVFKKSTSGNFNEPDEDSPSGYFIRTDDIELIEKTNLIKAHKGLIFGIKYIPESSRKNETAYFQCKIIHPQLVDPDNNFSFSSTTEDKCNYVNEENFDFFEFESDWEIKDGKWTFQILEDNKLLYEHEFIIQNVEQRH